MVQSSTAVTERSTEGLAERARRWLSETNLSDWGTRLALVCIAWAAVRHAWMYRESGVDDAFITFRHAYNLAHGHGPVYNPGERVEGTSSFSMMLLVTVALLLKCDAFVAAKVIGTASFVILAWLAYAIVKAVAPIYRRLLGLVAATCVTASTPLAVFSQSGLETVLYAAAVAAGILLLVRPSADPRRPFWALAMGFAATTRPEGPGFFLLFLGLDLLRSVAKGWPALLKRGALALAFFAAVFGPLIAFRVLYYHAWIPNSVLAKSGTPDRFANVHGVVAFVRAAMAGDGIKQAYEYLGNLAIAPLLLYVGLLHRRTAFTTLVCLAAFGGCVAVAVWNDGDWMGHFRLLTASIAPLYVAIALALATLLSWLPIEGMRAHAAAIALVLVVADVVVQSGDYERSYQVQKDSAPYAKWLAIKLSTLGRDDDLLATDMAGAFAYLSGLRTLDTFGLCDRTIAEHGSRYGVMGKVDWDYVVSRRPTFYWFNFTSAIANMYQLASFADQRNDYWAVITPAYRAYEGTDRKLLLVRRDRPGLDRLRNELGAEFVDPREELRRLGQWR